MPEETPEIRLKRLHIRSWRRGMKEMDLLLGPFSDGPIRALNAAALDAYEALLDENDQDLFRWFSGAAAVPSEHLAMVQYIQSSRN